LDRTFREAEQAGLRIAIKGRLVALVLLGAYLVVSRIANPEHALELGLGIALSTIPSSARATTESG
jgi:hypothetical protein